MSGEEQLSLNSVGEAVWDDFQEKYNSEAYSEDPPDSEAMNKLLNFGDDYSTAGLGSQSDCGSNLQYPTRQRKSSSDTMSDSDFDSKDLKRFMRKFQDQLKETEDLFNRSQASIKLIMDTDFVSFVSFLYFRMGLSAVVYLRN